MPPLTLRGFGADFESERLECAPHEFFSLFSKTLTKMQSQFVLGCSTLSFATIDQMGLLRMNILDAVFGSCTLASAAWLRSRAFSPANTRVLMHRAMRQVARRAATASLLLVPFTFVPAGHAQNWHRHTPRDTAYVPANSSGFTFSRTFAPSNLITADLYVSGTFSALPGQVPGKGFDAAYLYEDTAWKAPYPLKNPPSWNGTSYNIYMSCATDGQPASLRPLTFTQPDSVFQSSHFYTARVTGGGGWFVFRLYDRIGPAERPDGYYYGQNKGGLTVWMAQHTAGISVQYPSHDFGTVDVGTPKKWIDSIGSYGVDPLQVDSVWIDGPNRADFTFVSEHGGKFALPNESTNEFRIFYTPSTPKPATATLHIRSSNADVPDRLQTITLTGAGAAPQEEFGTSAIDFNLVQIGATARQSVIVNNSGNGQLIFDSIWVLPTNLAGIFSVQPNDTIAAPNQKPLIPVSAPIPINFHPAAMQKYSATAYFHSTTGQINAVSLTGEGAQPVITMDDTVVDFGSVRSFGQVRRSDTLRNIGNWTASIIPQLNQPFSFTPIDNPPLDHHFFLNAGANRGYVLTFSPGTMTNTTLTGKLIFYIDNGTQKIITLIGREERPLITYDTDKVYFGNVEVLTSKVREVGLDNAAAIKTGFFSTIISSDPKAFRLDNVRPDITFKPNTSIFDVGRDTMLLSFNPVQRGPASGWIRINANSQIDSIFMYGFATQAFPIFDPPILDYGVVPTGFNNYQLTELRDTGDAPLQICGVDVVGDPGFSLAPLKFPLPTTIPPDGKTKLLFGVNFKTNDRTGGKHYGYLEVHYCNGRTDTIPLIATEASQRLQFCDSHMDFGRVHVGTTAPLPIRLCNNTNIAIPISSIWITPGTSPFKPIFGSITVAPQSSDTSSTLAFQPLMRGSFSAMLHYRDTSGGQDSIAVSGIGVAAVSVLSPDTVTCEKTDVGSVSRVESLTLSDTGDWPLKATVLKINDRYNEFTITAPGGIIGSVPVSDPVASKGKSDYSVTFAPKYPKLPDHEAELVFSFDDGTSDTVTLIGHDRSGFLAIQQDTLNFGKVRIGAAPLVASVQLVNTSDTVLTAIAMKMPLPPFTTPSTTPISVSPGNAVTIPVTFTPTTMGMALDSIVGLGKPFVDSVGNRVVLVGIGAKPIPQFSLDTVDFGILTVGTPRARSLSLANKGNWPLATNWKITGPNAADFMAALAPDTTISEGDTASFAIDYVATTPLQLTPRTATLTFTLDDDPGAQFSVALIAHDQKPLMVPVSFAGQYAAHAGDYIFAYLRLEATVPDSIGLQHIHGTVTYDPSIIEELPNKRDQGSLVPAPLWKVSITDTLGTAGNSKTLVYDILSTTDTLRNPGALLKLTFKMRDGLQPGAQSQLATDPKFPDTREAMAVTTPSVIQLDSLCGQGHFTAGETAATFIQQNNPNPFGSSAPSTTLPFDVGEDNTAITIRVLDATGREVFRPLDKAIYAHGHYSIAVSATDVGSGCFFYEFEAQGQAPQVKKMTVQ